MNLYKIMNRETKELWHGEAESAQEACNNLGWMIGDCSIRTYSVVGSTDLRKSNDASKEGQDNVKENN